MNARGRANSSQIARTLWRRIEPLRTPQASELATVETAVRDAFGDVFEREGDRAGRWANLAVSTQEDRRRHGFPPAHPILRRTGSLRRSFENAHDQHAVSRLRVSGLGTQWRLYVGSSHPVAKYHEYGTRRMPRRKITDIHDDGRRRVRAALERWAEQAVK